MRLARRGVAARGRRPVFGRSGRGARRRPGPAALAALAVVACGAREPRPGEVRGGRDAEPPPPPPPPDAAAPTTPAGALPPYLVAPGDGVVEVRVEWKDAPAAARAAPGRDACGDPRPPRARIHTLHGVDGAVVWLDGIAAGRSPPPAPGGATVRFRGCRASPAVQVAPRVDSALEVVSDVEERVVVELGWLPALTAEAAPARAATVELPVIGHAVEVPLGVPWAVAVTGGRAPEPAWVIVPPHPYVAVTDDTGAARWADVPPGTYSVRAWLPPAAGAPARVAVAEVAVVAGQAAAVTLSLAEP